MEWRARRAGEKVARWAGKNPSPVQKATLRDRRPGPEGAGCQNAAATQTRSPGSGGSETTGLRGVTYPDKVRRQERAEARKKRRRSWRPGPSLVTLRMAELFEVFN